MKLYRFEMEILVEVPDDTDLCDDDPDQICYGECGGACNQYFLNRLRAYLNNDKAESSTEWLSSVIAKAEETPELDCRAVAT